MAILIDSFHNGARGPVRFWHRRCGHLVSDTSIEELQEFAEGLGLRREWLQRGSIPHYDVTGEHYDLALARGAVLVSSREIVRRAVRWPPANALPPVNVRPDNLSVAMLREHLEAIPRFASPPGFLLRWFRPGDEQRWQEIQAAADQYNTISHELFTRQFGTDLRLLEERQCFIIDDHEKAVGTATAWFDPDYNGRPYGRVHWVAIVPERQGRGLAKPLLTAVCHRLRELGHDRAYLTTSTARVPAINLYLKFGFIPEVRGPSDSSVWRELQGRLKYDFHI